MSRATYLAGFFDGEGCVSLNSNGSIQLRVINTYKPVLDLFVEEFGGSVKIRKQRINKSQYHWSVYGDDAYEVAKILGELCIEKADQLHVVMDWFEIRDQYKSKQATGRGRHAHPDRANKIKEIQTTLTGMKFNE